jgi:hypothetical protein
MNPELSSFAARLRGLIEQPDFFSGGQPWHGQFDFLARRLFALQYENNSAYRKICDARRLTPPRVADWSQIPALPTSAFKELELTSIPPAARTAGFRSSGTTGQKPSRHFHCAESLAVYETSLWHWFQPRFGAAGELLFLTPGQNAAPQSSLVHMFETIRRKSGRPESAFVGGLAADGSWAVDFTAAIQKLKSAGDSGKPLTLLGTAFSFVHLLDDLAGKNLRFELPASSRVMETGGYKNRSRVLPKADLHALIVERLGVRPENIVCEYGMSELSSQAYDVTSDQWPATRDEAAARSPQPAARVFHFPPWARAQIISPETGREVAGGETGLIRVFDLANVFSVAAVQTEDLGIRRGDGFELIGRAPAAEPRGCSLMTA